MKKIKQKFKKTSLYWFLLGMRESRRIITSDVYGDKKQEAYDKGRELANDGLKKLVKALTVNSISI